MHAPGTMAGSRLRKAPAQSECSPNKHRRPGTKSVAMAARPCRGRRAASMDPDPKKEWLAHRRQDAKQQGATMVLLDGLKPAGMRFQEAFPEQHFLLLFLPAC